MLEMKTIIRVSVLAIIYQTIQLLIFGLLSLSYRHPLLFLNSIQIILRDFGFGKILERSRFANIDMEGCCDIRIPCGELKYIGNLYIHTKILELKTACYLRTHSIKSHCSNFFCIIPKICTNTQNFVAQTRVRTSSTPWYVLLEIPFLWPSSKPLKKFPPKQMDGGEITSENNVYISNC